MSDGLSDCLKLFQAAPIDRQRAVAIDQASPDCRCEACVVSPYGGDPVASDEVLVRLVLDPNHIVREEGKMPRLKSAFFSDSASVGSSTLRKGSAKTDEYHAAVREMLEQNPVADDGSKKKVYGVALFNVATVKSIKHQLPVPGKKDQFDECVAFCVYATADKTKPAHADIMVNRVSSISRSKSNRAGINLSESSGISLLTVDEFSKTIDLSQWA